MTAEWKARVVGTIWAVVIALHAVPQNAVDSGVSAESSAVCGAAGGDDASSAGGQLYWILNYPNVIQRSKVDGSNVEDIVEGLSHPQALAVDEARGKLYWTDSNNLADTLHRSNLDGSDVETLLTDVASWGLVVDSASEKLYWTDIVARHISRSNLDGTEVEVIVDELEEPSGLTLDAAGGFLYWSDFGTFKVQRAPLSDPKAIQDVAANLSHPTGVVLDSSGRVYWADSGAFKLQRATLDGTIVEDVLGSDLKDPHGLAMDVEGGYLYWTTTGTVYEKRKGPSSQALSNGKIQRLRVEGLEVDPAGEGSSGAAAAPDDIRHFGRSRPIAVAFVGGRGSACSQTGVRRLRVGDFVQLRDKILGEADEARKGPLRPGDVGRISADDKSDQPFMVSVEGQEWWYREDALQLSVPP